MTTVRYENAVTRYVADPEMRYRRQVIQVLAAARHECSDIALAAAVSKVQDDYVYLDRIVDGLDETGKYFDTMVEEFNYQANLARQDANDESDLAEVVRMRVLAIRAEAKAEAYLDAARVLNIPFVIALGEAP